MSERSSFARDAVSAARSSALSAPIRSASWSSSWRTVLSIRSWPAVVSRTATARREARDAARFCAAGDSVIITGRDPGRLADTALEIGARAIACDATDPGPVQRMAAEVGADLDVLVNMAGGNVTSGGRQFLRPSAARTD